MYCIRLIRYSAFTTKPKKLDILDEGDHAPSRKDQCNRR